jgi:hypothetical protein
MDRSNDRPVATEAKPIPAQGEEPGRALELRASARELYETREPEEILARATADADILKRALREQGMIQRVGDRDHIKIEGWQTVGILRGVTAIPIWTRPIEPRSEEGHWGWECRVEAHSLSGQILGAGEAMVTRHEKRWASAEDYALRSMAQTRAQSKALKSVFAFVVTLAGYSPTPAEEMGEEPKKAEKPWGPPASRALVAKAATAVRYLLTDDFGPEGAAAGEERGRAAIEEIRKDAGGYLPAGALRALVRIASSLRGEREGGGEEEAVEGAVEGDPPPAEEEQIPEAEEVEPEEAS